jgi:hypothetical protein
MAGAFLESKDVGSLFTAADPHFAYSATRVPPPPPVRHPTRTAAPFPLYPPQSAGMCEQVHPELLQ